MKNLFLAIILGAHITAAGQPLMTDTDVPTEGAEEGEEEDSMWVGGTSPVWVHGPNDEPIYYILNDDASYYEVDEKTYIQLCKEYCAVHNQTYFDGYPADHPGETIEALAGKWALLRTNENYQAAQLAAHEVLSASDIPDDAMFMAPGHHLGIDWDDPMFTTNGQTVPITKFLLKPIWTMQRKEMRQFQRMAITSRLEQERLLSRQM